MSDHPANKIYSMTVPELRKVFAQAAVELGVPVKVLAASAKVNVDNTPESLTSFALLEVERKLTVTVKTGKQVLWKAYTYGGTDRMVDEVRFDMTAADAAISRCLDAAKS